MAYIVLEGIVLAAKISDGVVLDQIKTYRWNGMGWDVIVLESMRWRWHSREVQGR